MTPANWARWLTALALLLVCGAACTAVIDGPDSAPGSGAPVGPSSNQLMCQPGLTACNGACVNLQTENGNCGACGTACTAPAICASGSCNTACAQGFQKCGDSCVDLNASPLHCGACTTACSTGQTCQTGQCQQCGQATDIVCDNTCADPQTDANHCGDCAIKCLGGLPCTAGKCACPDGQTLCEGRCVSTDSTASDCGACGMACPAGESCGGGKCSGSFGDSCTSTLAVGISIDEISVYQVGKIPVMEKDAPVAKADRPADIIQGKAGRVRVFTKLESGWANRTVSARLLLTNNGVKSNYSAKRAVTQDSAENSFATTFNIDVKAEDFTADTHYAVELVECDGAPAGMPGKPRFPVTADQELVTRKTGTIKIVFVPLNANGKIAASDKARLDAYQAYVAQIYPTSGVEYTTAKDPLVLSQTISAEGNGWSEALDQMSNRHETDNAPADTYYFGLLQPTDTLGQYCGSGCVAGIGFVTDTSNNARHNRVALGLSYANATSAQTMAHELGHNHGRQHSPCGGAADPDPKFPYAGAKIGWWGFEAPEKLHNPANDTDIMGYCNNLWVSDYVYRAWTERVAFMNGAVRELPPVGDMHHYLFLLTDFLGPRWGLERPAPRYPSGDPEQADILDASGNVIESVTVYRTPIDHLGGSSLMVPDPEPGWHAIRIQGEVPLAFGAKTQSQ